VSLIPEKVANFDCYDGNGRALLGTTDAELPKFEGTSETVMGAGMAGEIESITPGHFKSQQVKLKWRTITEAGLRLLAPVNQAFSLYGALQIQDSTSGALLVQSLRIDVVGVPKNFDVGKFEPGKPMASEMDVELLKIIINIDDKPIVELDKLNMIYKVNGVDYLQTVRAALGRV
jgi:P2 family phage contractile tail tube protein